MVIPLQFSFLLTFFQAITNLDDHSKATTTSSSDSSATSSTASASSTSSAPSSSAPSTSRTQSSTASTVQEQEFELKLVSQLAHMKSYEEEGARAAARAAMPVSRYSHSARMGSFIIQKVDLFFALFNKNKQKKFIDPKPITSPSVLLLLMFLLLIYCSCSYHRIYFSSYLYTQARGGSQEQARGSQSRRPGGQGGGLQGSPAPGTEGVVQDRLLLLGRLSCMY